MYRQNQIRWQQFSIEHRRQESAGNDLLNERRKEERDNQDETFDIAVSPPKRSRPIQKHSTTPKKARVQTPITSETETEKTHEHVQKSKTRAARRAIDTNITESTPEKPNPTKRERRTDYYVQRDTKRRSAARTLKFQDQLPE